ncbi:homogentisate 1,2-dioxygenase [bacterium]|nr:homogentisate 1,2-dioxygenase [bacterium]
MSLNYLQGFKNHFVTESEKGILPVGQNSPQTVAKGLFAEQISGSAFTAPRHLNLRTWVYRKHPSVSHGNFESKVQIENFVGSNFNQLSAPPTQMRWNPLEPARTKGNFLESLHTVSGSGGPEAGHGCAIHLYATQESMKNSYFYNADAEMMIVPTEGKLLLRTEMGKLEIGPLEIAVIPKGIRFAVDLQEKSARGYLCENFGNPFVLPELGPIGANGLANPRDFQAPTAWVEEKTGKVQLFAKFLGEIWTSEAPHTPLDVVAWHGNFTPYKYNLLHFNTINSVSFDHPDPSIFTVLTSPSETAGTANIDFVIFPPRWMVSEHSFRPPYFHRNVMNELMGLIQGQYDAKSDGFAPGGLSLHNCMSGHGPDKETFDKASKAELKPEKYDNTMAFMFESRHVFRTTPWALSSDLRQNDYPNCWLGL